MRNPIEILNWFANIMSRPAPEELVDLAEHHRDILKRRFPSHEYILFKSSTGCSISVAVPTGSVIFEASFLLSGVLIAPPTMDHIFINYADPKFTDNILVELMEQHNA